MRYIKISCFFTLEGLLIFRKNTEGLIMAKTGFLSLSKTESRLPKKKEGTKSKLKALKTEQDLSKESRAESLKSEEIKKNPTPPSDSIGFLRKVKTAKSRLSGEGSPLELTLRQSESLKTAQARIGVLERELSALRRDKESLISAGEVLRDGRDQLLAENEDLRRIRGEDRESFEDEKRVLMETLEEVKREKLKLEETNKSLEKRLSGGIQNVQARELALEGQLEIMKLESLAIQREKDAKIIDLQKTNRKLNGNLSMARKKAHELQIRMDKLRGSVRRSLSVLRAAIHNLSAVPTETADEEAFRDEND